MTTTLAKSNVMHALRGDDASACVECQRVVWWRPAVTVDFRRVDSPIGQTRKRPTWFLTLDDPRVQPNRDILPVCSARCAKSKFSEMMNSPFWTSVNITIYKLDANGYPFDWSYTQSWTATLYQKQEVRRGMR